MTAESRRIGGCRPFWRKGSVIDSGNCDFPAL